MGKRLEKIVGSLAIFIGTTAFTWGICDLGYTFIKGRNSPSEIPNYAQRIENDRFAVGIGGALALGAAYLTYKKITKESENIYS